MGEDKADKEEEKSVLVCREQYGSSAQKKEFFSKEGKLDMNDTSTKYSSLTQAAKSVFLPRGYPESVSVDYLPYQTWDTVQAFASSITGTLASHAVLKGVGVGDENATVLAATITWLLKDGAGMLGRIVFAWYQGSGLDCDAKRWRLFADILNDFSIFLSLLAPSFGCAFTPMLCVVGLCSSIVGVAGGATRAALTQHQARRNNMADVSAKDGSQETLVNFAGLICSLILVPLVTGHQIIIWVLFILFTSLHVVANYKAVRAVCMETINQTRLHFIVQRFLRVNLVPTVREANQMEPVLLPLKRSMKIHLGASLSSVMSTGVSFATLKDVYEISMTGYLLGIDFEKKTIQIVLAQSSDIPDQLQACFHAEFICFIVEKLQEKEELSDELKKLGNLVQDCLNSKNLKQDDLKSVLSTSLHFVESSISSFERELHVQGWVTETALLGADEWRALWDFKSLAHKKAE